MDAAPLLLALAVLALPMALAWWMISRRQPPPPAPTSAKRTASKQ